VQSRLQPCLGANLGRLSNTRSSKREYLQGASRPRQYCFAALRRVPRDMPIVGVAAWQCGSSTNENRPRDGMHQSPTQPLRSHGRTCRCTCCKGRLGGTQLLRTSEAADRQCAGQLATANSQQVLQKKGSPQAPTWRHAAATDIRSSHPRMRRAESGLPPAPQLLQGWPSPRTARGRWRALASWRARASWQRRSSQRSGFLGRNARELGALTQGADELEETGDLSRPAAYAPSRTSGLRMGA
jgi:hypothetical protein